MIGKKLINTGGAAVENLPSGYFNTVTYTGNGGSQRIGGYINRGAVFNGSSSVIVTTLGNSQLPVSSSWSCSCWINSSSFSSATNILGMEDGSSPYYGWSLYQNTSGVLYPMVNGNLQGSGTTLTANQWYNVILTYNGTVLKFYVNGSQIGSDITTSISAPSSNFDVGNLGIYSVYNGKVDQVRIFDKALSSSEVTTLYGETHASTTKSTTDIFSDNSGVALYQLDGNANDTGGASGYIGEGAIFNGSSSIIKSSSLGTEFRGQTTLSISAWFNTSASGRFTITSFSATGDASTDLWLGLESGENTIGFRNVNDGTNTLQFDDSGGSSVRDGNWHHVVFTADSGGTHLYVDGNELTGFTYQFGSSSTTVVMPTDLNQFAIGANTDSSGDQWFMNGTIDQVRIFDKALSSSEVITLYGETASSNITISDLVAYYPMEGTSLDQEGSYHGTDTNVEYNYNGTATNVTYQEATNFSPDLIWIKNRDANSDPIIQDTVRGITKMLETDGTAAESDNSVFGHVDSVESNGFTVDSGGSTEENANKTGRDYAAWCFNAGTDAAASNTDGSITSTVKANQDAGFSIVKFTGPATNVTATVGHGLSQAPELVITKILNSSVNWYTSIGGITGNDNDYLSLNTTDAVNNNPSFVFGPHSSTTFTTSQAFSGNNPSIAYCFHSVDGIQKVGSYTSQYPNTTHVETGFEPAFVMIKSYNQARNWCIHDNKRKVTNSDQRQLYANLSSAEADIDDQIEFTSNGFTVKGGSNDLDGGSSYSYIYLAIAADPDTTTPTVEDSFEVVTYTGNGGTQSIDTGFKPDLVWIKHRNQPYTHALHDSVRGVQKLLRTNTTNAEYSSSNPPAGTLTSFDSNGFTITEDATWTLNNSSTNYVAWCWKAGDHDDNLPQINTEGTIDSVVSVNDAAGFSVVKHTAPSTEQNYTIGHGLSQKPDMVILKGLDSASSWFVWHKDLSQESYYLYLNLTNSESGLTQDTRIWGQQSFTNSVISMRSNYTTLLNQDYIAYCFTSITGYQKIGSYTGTGATGNAVTTGFSPKFVMIKDTTQGGNWIIHSKPPTTTNPSTTHLRPNSSAGEDSGAGEQINFDSNGFTIVGTGGNVNTNNDVYLYLAIA